MSSRLIGLIVLLLLAPAAGLYLAGYPYVARDLFLGTLLAFRFGVLARPLAPFSFLIAGVYVAASMTAHFSGGVAALIVAAAAATGAASSLGYHRGLLAILAAALLGSFEPAPAPAALWHGFGLFAGCLYGFVLASSVGRTLVLRQLAVHSGTALGYSVLLAVLVLIAWLTARAVGLEQGWWLPLTVATLGAPWLQSTPGNAVMRLAFALAGTLLALGALEALADPSLRAACAVALLAVSLKLGRGRPALQDFLLTPTLVLVAAGDAGDSSGLYLQGTLLALAVVATFAVLGKWVLWTLRPDSGHVVSA